MCVLTRDRMLCRRRVKGGALLLLFAWLSSNAMSGQELGPAIGGGEVSLVKWAMSQGGAYVITILLGISYRRDLLGLIREQKQALSDLRSEMLSQRQADEKVMTSLVAMVEKSTAASERLTAAVNALAVEVRRVE